MSFLMALFTKCYTISDVKSKLWIFRERLDVVCVEFTTSFVAILTSIIISFKNLFTPQMIFNPVSKNHILSCFATLPIRCFFTIFEFSGTTTRAKKTFINSIFFAIIRFTAKFTDFIFSFSKVPVVIRWFEFFSFCYYGAFLTTISLFIDKVRKNIKLFFTNRTGFVNAFFPTFISTLSATIGGFVYIIGRYIKTFMTSRTDFINTFFHYYNFNIIEGVGQLRSEK